MPTEGSLPDFNLGTVATGLRLDPDGIWRAAEKARVSYSEDGNDYCYQLEDRSFWFRHRNACIASVVRRFPPAGTILDIGGGNGFVARGLIDAGFPTALLEPGESGAAHARGRGIAQVVCADFDAARFLPGSLPAAGLFDVLEHIPDDVRFLESLREKLVTGGKLYLTVPAGAWLWSADDRDAGHFRRYSIRRLEKTLRAAGFRPLYGTKLFSILPPAVFALRTLRSLWGLRRLPIQTYDGLHEVKVGGLTDRVWAWEERRIRAGRRIPVGTSCLAAAEKA